jgi:hypothetical protein
LAKICLKQGIDNPPVSPGDVFYDTGAKQQLQDPVSDRRRQTF